MKWIELFAGIGGFRLGLESAGHKVVWANELDPYACQVYRKRWPDDTLFEGDIQEVRAADLPEHDGICGGFPCQDLSVAGKRAGIHGDRSGLFFEITRLARDSGTRWLFLENVPGILSGEGMGEVLRELAEGGYDAEWDCIPASAAGAPHRRERIWIVAHSNGRRQKTSRAKRSRDDAAEGQGQINPEHIRTAPVASCSEKPSDADRMRELQSKGGKPKIGRRISDGSWWETEPDVVRVVDGLSDRPHGSDRIKCLGLAVVPQVVDWIARRIND